MNTNLEYLIYAIKNPEKAIDTDYSFLKASDDIEKYVKVTKEIKEILITVKQLKKEKADKETLESFYKKLQNVLSKYSNCSEFVCFFKAFGSNLKYVSSDLFLLKKVTEHYLRYRNITELTPREWIQALIDNNSSRKKGHVGERKVIQELVNVGFELVNNLADLQNKKMAVAQITKKEFSLKKIKKELGIKMKGIRQEKVQDVIFKIGQEYYVLEAKNINDEGGAQNSSISELIFLIGIKEKNKHIHFISFMDGKTVNNLLDENLLNKQGNLKEIRKTENKIEVQRKEIVKNLKNHPNNYFLNTASLKKFLQDLLDKQK
ncbi:hypothetical protein COX27_01660 [Candidatus Kuenenbacteria bacterium CG23_combo_of_CG06-09_8_20_14_all_36_9]|uniref:Uncharacterized protein n=1 Tax=Candidatus Kuenenbacteria bacterium CG10_big_fil_rev_8_21_14_0_10_36_11 TaxID=1974618 RepID=A0A2M6WA80_9BACT|nr:MAG: hypothetical protein COX27_01660 [Candidatus Kuenenbacteria bacterium CG23_combo_of_CG06-09_8_20_14_all_36_9]PIT89667.1 MAG: hypothetical protein COU23_02675 [Candidatus Kuenenbacteria bacterium CG10_big_fil_rev_8_21_14_0_10_36_11]